MPRANSGLLFAVEPAPEDGLKSPGRAVLECRDNLAFLESLPERSFQLIVTSPPYNIGKEYEKKSSLERYLADQEAVIGRCVRLLKPGGSICWQVGNHISSDRGVVPLDIVLYPTFTKLGLILRNRIVWHFEHGLHCTHRFSGRYETVLWFTHGERYLFNLDPVRVPPKYPGKKYFKGPRAGQYSCNPLGKNPGDVWAIPNVKANHVEKTEHPCQFPVELVERLVLSMTAPGDGVLDPYVGSGSSVIAAVKNGRDGYGCDIERKYIDIAKRRVADFYAGKLQTRPIERPIYDPRLPGGGH
ncbi:MAG: DNA-methyltransferase [Phycisphaerae bacterium]